MAKVISAAQQRQTLAAKKKPPPRQQLKNVFAQPFARHWPECTADEAHELIDRIAAVRLPATDENKDASAPRSIWRSAHCTIGLQATLRRLNKPSTPAAAETSSADATPPTKRVDLLLLAADIRPKFIVDQILLLAHAHNPAVRSVLVPGLPALLQSADRLGLPACMCVSLNDCAGGLLPALADVYAYATELAVRFPWPAAAQRQPVHTTAGASEHNQAPPPQPRRPLPAVRIDELHLKRRGTGASAVRAFVPAGTTAERPPTTGDWSDFISLGGTEAARPKNTKSKQLAGVVKPKHSGPSAIEEMKRRMQVPAAGVGNKYRTLTVNRVQGNPNKVRKSKPTPTATNGAAAGGKKNNKR